MLKVEHSQCRCGDVYPLVTVTVTVSFATVAVVVTVTVTWPEGLIGIIVMPPAADDVMTEGATAVDADAAGSGTICELCFTGTGDVAEGGTVIVTTEGSSCCDDAASDGATADEGAGRADVFGRGEVLGEGRMTGADDAGDDATTDEATADDTALCTA